MSEALTCAKCGSDRIIPAASIRETMQGGYAVTEVYEYPDAVLLRGACRSPVVARVCGRCGFVELFATDPGPLWRTFAKRRERD